MDSIIQSMDCNNIAKIEDFGSSHLPKLSSEKLSNYEFIGAISRFNVETEVFINQILNDRKVDLAFLKRVQVSISRLSRASTRLLKLVDDIYMAKFLEQCIRCYKSFNRGLIEEITKRHKDSYDDKKHKELSSKYKDISKVYANE